MYVIISFFCNKILLVIDMKKILLFIMFLLPNIAFALSVPSNNAILYDAESNRILFQKNINQKHLIASTTKIMTT